MSESKEAAKAAKKEAKTQAKLEKKRRAAGMADPVSTSIEAAPANAPHQARSPTPAERSAAAAERQVRLHRWRIWIAVLTGLIALATAVITLNARWWEAKDKPAEDTTIHKQPRIKDGVGGQG